MIHAFIVHNLHKPNLVVSTKLVAYSKLNTLQTIFLQWAYNNYNITNLI